MIANPPNRGPLRPDADGRIRITGRDDSDLSMHPPCTLLALTQQCVHCSRDATDIRENGCDWGDRFQKKKEKQR
ncbi:MAG: hypothetical protein AAF721_00350 [Myxococcota bacterium]